MLVLGIDPGLQTSGYAVLRQHGPRIEVVDAGAIRAETRLPIEKRLHQIYRDIDAILNEYPVQCMAIEELYAHYKHPRTAILMGHARGMFLLAAAGHGVETLGFSATRIKKSLVGHGRASKQQIQHAVKTQLGLATIPTPADVADALAIAMCCLNEISRTSPAGR